MYNAVQNSTRAPKRATRGNNILRGSPSDGPYTLLCYSTVPTFSALKRSNTGLTSTFPIEKLLDTLMSS